MTAAIATPRGILPAANGEPLTAERAPVLGLIAYAETFLLRLFATQTDFPVGSTAIRSGLDPAAIVEPLTSESAPRCSG